MPKHKVSVHGDNALREFYEACGLAPETIEGAIKIRYREPPPVTAARETNLAKRLRERRKRNATAVGAMRQFAQDGTKKKKSKDEEC